MPESQLAVTLFTKRGGPLTKRIALRDDRVISDGSACVMTEGAAQRVHQDGAADLAALLDRMQPTQAIALGTLRPDLPDRVEIRPQAKVSEASGPVISRTKDNLIFVPGTPGWTLIDYDQKGMPTAVARRIDELDGFWPALASVLPALAIAARVERASTSAGLYRGDTGARINGSGGRHVYVRVCDSTDIERFLRALHARSWLSGFGWMMVGAGGQLLERSIVDRVVGSPERLVFEGPPVLEEPLRQDAAARKPLAIEGGPLDSAVVCPPLTIAETSRLNELRARETTRLAPERTASKQAFVERHARRLVDRDGITYDRAAQIIERQCEGVLLPNIELPFDDPALAGTTVGQVLAYPERYEGATLADPLEGVEYGRGKAKIMRRDGGATWIHSFAHGRTTYELRHDAKTIEVAIERAPADQVADLFVRLVLAGDINPADQVRLITLAARRSGIGSRALGATLKEARAEETARGRQEERTRRLAERTDPRPAIPVPSVDAPWLPQLETLEEIIGASTAAEPPARGAERIVMQLQRWDFPSLHSLTSLGANDDDN